MLALGHDVHEELRIGYIIARDVRPMFLGNQFITNTKDMLQRRNFHLDDDVNFILCAEGFPESGDHLLWNYRFSKAC